MGLERLVLEQWPRVRGGIGNTGLDDARTEAFEVGHPRLGGVARLRLAAVADSGWLADEADGASGQSRLGHRRSVSKDHMSATSSTVRAIGPTVSSVGTSGKTPSMGMSPHCDFKPDDLAGG